MPNSSERVEVTTYFLHMHAAPNRTTTPMPLGARVVRAEVGAMSADEYLDLYHSVGAPWLWYERSDLDTEALLVLIQAPNVDIYLLLFDEQVAGFCEICTSDNEVQILYFGLKPDAIGKGLGASFLNWIVTRVFSDQQATTRLWVHTCSLDHERAQAVYASAGFVEYARESGWVTIPGKALERQNRLANE